MSAKADFTNQIPQKIRQNKEYCGIPQNKGHEFHNIFKFCGTTPQIIPTHVFFRPVKYFAENRFRFRKSISTSEFTNRIRTFFVEFRFVNSAFANTLLENNVFSIFVESTLLLDISSCKIRKKHHILKPKYSRS